MTGRTAPLRVFLSELARRPKQMGCVWPSSGTLGEAMARWLPEGGQDPILELGPGTGAVTRKLIEAGLPEDRLVAVEMSERMAGILRKQFPKARIVAGDALELDRMFAGTRFGAVFSSLPLKAFSPVQVQRVSDAIHAVLLPGAPWVQYTYQLINGHAPAKTFRAVHSRIVWQNLPPAKVSAYRSALAG